MTEVKLEGLFIKILSNTVSDASVILVSLYIIGSCAVVNDFNNEFVPYNRHFVNTKAMDLK